ncbi:5-methyltetrahydropteroyltriglutamate--homocysteine S-methyltransferase [Sinomicrobium weinanense]|uniref:5-methyltetrahydropteroyltriglutamate--homocysteine methyltransferase n=1 Tax=Sinomicrobium weinanense TaxID=2842200 RepID=A0A926Q2M2_9FLAO|nr:5-methyltetrahydropteroyltriglutamate--homocysteine S-methyltransferase [Sinomicrobium weinanense]MBC9794815.1 5-methyltetrahydropteroyltriglutamate--homocysteine S-methyltransferase [Sinomicrobium weinanense]MBU3125074.1 5-methyltetrahydropteroyltriglutamate--homocysteine S-methyltransferase [Sinomicrobium weinanense]
MQKNNLGYPRIGARRELKKACEQYWAGKTSREELLSVAEELRRQNWTVQQEAGIDLVPCNDFSFYDQVLDMTLSLGAIPKRYTPVLTENKENTELDLYFAMARGYQKNGLDITAMEMTKWFDTNYHYIVPEFYKDQSFRRFSSRITQQFTEARKVLDKTPKPVLIGPVSYLLLGKEKEEGFHRIELLKKLLPVYVDILNELRDLGAEWIQLDEPFLSLDLTEEEKNACKEAYATIAEACKGLKIMVTTYFEALGDNTALAVSLPVSALHVDLVRAPQQLDTILETIPENLILSLGVVDGRNIWKNDYNKSLQLLRKAIAKLGVENVMIATSCSLLHTPYDLEAETGIDPEIRNWLAFAKQKLGETVDLYEILNGNAAPLEANQKALADRRASSRIHKKEIKERVAGISGKDTSRHVGFALRQKIQKERFGLPLYPTTTIGSFPQTTDIRRLRARLKKGELTQAEYESRIEEATIEAIRIQESIGLDVLVHGEFERNDMVEYFGELLEGFIFTKNGWVQSYGSRCVKPPIIYGDVSRPEDMTVRWSRFSQEHTGKIVKGMLTGPVTILQWSFVRDDQPRQETTFQIALAIRDEVLALEKAGIQMIQIDEPAIREGLPLRKKDWPAYLDWAIRAFRIAASGVKDETQIHTHMCYSEFNDIIEHIAAMDADVITIETSRSQMELLEAFADFKYPNEIGPGVYDIHSPRVPTVEEMVVLLEKASDLLPAENIWVNPDCGLKTRKWEETEAALVNMVQAAKKIRKKVDQPVS